ncbi:MAG: CxC ATPase DNA modification system associated small protein [Actinomycetota bacterium]
MGLDKKVYEAIYETTRNNGQPEKVAKRMMQWLEQLSDGTATLLSQDDIRASLNTILEAIQTDNSQEDDED